WAFCSCQSHMSATVTVRRNILWALARTERPSRLLYVGLADKDESVRQVAAYSSGLKRDPKAAPSLIGLLQDPSLAVRREAATSLGRIASPEAVMPIFKALRGN